MNNRIKFMRRLLNFFIIHFLIINLIGYGLNRISCRMEQRI